MASDPAAADMKKALAAVKRWRKLSDQADEAHDAARAACLAALANGASERTVARETGVTRTSLRKWQGKPSYQ